MSFKNILDMEFNDLNDDEADIFLVECIHASLASRLQKQAAAGKHGWHRDSIKSLIKKFHIQQLQTNLRDSDDYLEVVDMIAYLSMIAVRMAADIAENKDD